MAEQSESVHSRCVFRFIDVISIPDFAPSEKPTYADWRQDVLALKALPDPQSEGGQFDPGRWKVQCSSIRTCKAFAPRRFQNGPCRFQNGPCRFQNGPAVFKTPVSISKTAGAGAHARTELPDART